MNKTLSKDEYLLTQYIGKDPETISMLHSQVELEHLLACKLVMELRAQYSLVQMNGETQIYNTQLVQMRSNLCR